MWIIRVVCQFTTLMLRIYRASLHYLEDFFFPQNISSPLLRRPLLESGPSPYYLLCLLQTCCDWKMDIPLSAVGVQIPADSG